MFTLIFGLATACGTNTPEASIKVNDPQDSDGATTADASDSSDGISMTDGSISDSSGTDTINTPDNTGVDGSVCTPNCGGKECGDDGCDGSCGSCGLGMNCQDGGCLRGCDSPDCGLSKSCVFANGTPALCGGTLTFETSLNGQSLNVNVDIEDMFAAAGVLLYTNNSNAHVTTNSYNLSSASGGNSCATLDNGGDPWQSPVFIRFIKPGLANTFQAATHFVSLYLGNTWPGGLAVDFYAPTTPPGTPAATPFHTELTDANGTDYIEYGSADPIGYLVIHAADDPDFTMDDLTFGPLYVP